jgi:hypothetical protein
MRHTTLNPASQTYETNLSRFFVTAAIVHEDALPIPRQTNEVHCEQKRSSANRDNDGRYRETRSSKDNGKTGRLVPWPTTNNRPSRPRQTE